MRLSELNNQKVCILGYGREGQAIEQAIQEYAPGATLTIRDQKDGGNYLDGLDAFDVIIKSPGIPPQPEFEDVKDKMTNSTQIFLDTGRAAGALVIGVTGSKGKSTTASLLAYILKEAEKPAALVGNIGEPAISHLAEAKPDMIFVLEMSSYQLMDVHTSPPIAVVTSFFPEHLDYHQTLEAYMEAKKHIARFQTAADSIYYNATNDGTTLIAQASSGRQVPITADDCPVLLLDTQLIGEHNRTNIALAAAVARDLGVAQSVINEAARTFAPLPHRLQSLGLRHGIEWINDSISTTPESAIAALDALGSRVGALLLGGQDRGFDYTTLGERIARSNVELVVVFPDSGEKIRQAIQATHAKVAIQEVTTMGKAVAMVRGFHFTEKVPICVLSPASPSYNHYLNFEERGKAFAAAIQSA